ncbi:MAG: hypothetical protein PHT07_17265 [Paludibacter sp.]|nr:hypothetical protein [Paludibacter sp.]
MKQVLTFVMCLFVLCDTSGQVKSTQKPVLNTLEDFFRFKNVDQLTACFGDENVFTEITYFGDPNKGAKPYLVSQVESGTNHAVLVVWNRKGTSVYEVKTSINIYDTLSKKLKILHNSWKNYQGIYAGMSLSQMVKINWFVLKFRVHPGRPDHGMILPGFGWLKESRRVSFLNEKLVYTYTLDLKSLKKYFPGLSSQTLKSNDKTVRKWNPMVELVTIYRDEVMPE